MVSAQQTNFDTLMTDHGPMIARIAASYEADKAHREDLMQDIAVAVWRAMDRFEGRSSAKTFIARIAHNRAITHVSKQARQPKPAPVDEQWSDGRPTPEDQTAERLRQEQLMRAVRGLPVILKEVAALALEGFSPSDIAQTLGITPTNASVRLNRAKAALKAALEDGHE